MHHENHEAVGALLALLRSEGYQCRSYEDETGIELLWKPKPSAMPPNIREQVRLHAGALACILVPQRPGKVRPTRPFWTSDSSDPCIGCGHSCIGVDPLGQPRHDWCGWMGQKPAAPQVSSHHKRQWHSSRPQGKNAPASLRGA